MLPLWEYGFAYYSQKDGILPDIKTRLIEVEAGPKVRQFFVEAGKQGWEFCGTIPDPSGKPETTLIFKRAIAT